MGAAPNTPASIKHSNNHNNVNLMPLEGRYAQELGWQEENTSPFRVRIYVWQKTGRGTTSKTPSFTTLQNKHAERKKLSDHIVTRITASSCIHIYWFDPRELHSFRKEYFHGKTFLGLPCKCCDCSLENSCRSSSEKPFVFVRCGEYSASIHRLSRVASWPHLQTPPADPTFHCEALMLWAVIYV